MSERLPELTNQRLESELSALAMTVEYPPTPALATAVRRRLDAGEGREGLRIPTRPRWQTAAIALGILVLAFAGTLAFSPTARQAVADFLGVAGIHIKLENEPLVTPGSQPDLRNVDLGERVSLEAAESYVDFDVRVPTAIKGPEEIYLDRSVPGGMISILYPGPTDPDHREFLVMEFQADLEEGFFKKVAVNGGEISYPLVGDAHGYWIGDPHEFYYVDADGAFRQDTARLAGKVLLWERDGITYRVEGADSLNEALHIALSLR